MVLFIRWRVAADGAANPVRGVDAIGVARSAVGFGDSGANGLRSWVATDACGRRPPHLFAFRRCSGSSPKSRTAARLPRRPLAAG
jgi:hypothetical protein